MRGISVWMFTRIQTGLAVLKLDEARIATLHMSEVR